VEQEELSTQWNAVRARYADMDNMTARFNVTLLDALLASWAETVRPDTSMFTVLFTLPGQSGYEFHERVEVLMDAHDRVRMALVRQVPRRGGGRIVGSVTVTGDYTQPENALPAVEALLYQLDGGGNRHYPSPL